MTEWTKGLIFLAVLGIAALMLFGCGRDDLGALLVRWPF